MKGQPMSDRAEQAKASIAALEREHREWQRGNIDGYTSSVYSDAAAALSASEAEVTRLQAGIRRALTVEDRHTDKAFYVIVGLMVAELEAALSQPTTDTNGAHA